MCVIASFAIAAGCGGDDEDDTTTTTTSATESATGATGAEGASEFATQANEICEEGSAQVDEEAQEFFSGGQPSPQEEEQFAEEVAIPNIEQQVEEVTSLTPPEGQEDAFEQLTEEADAAVEAMKADPSLITSQGTEDPFADVNEVLTELGATECAG